MPGELRDAGSLLASARRSILLFLLVATPLIMAPSFTLDEHNIPKLALLMVGVPLALAVRTAEVMFGAGPAGWRVLAVPATAISLPLTVAWLLSPHRGYAIWGDFTRLQGLVPYLIVVVFGVLLFEAWAARPVVIAWAMALSGAIAGAVATYQMLFLGYDIRGISTSGYVTATLGHSNFAGGFLAITLPVAVVLWLRGGKGKWPALVCTAVIADGLLFTFSQGGWAAAVGGVAVTIGLYFWNSKRLVVASGLALFAAVVLVSVGVVVAPLVSPSLAASSAALESSRLRGFSWVQAVDVFAERPVTGWGPNSFALEAPLRRVPEESLLSGVNYADDPHSVPLSMAANAGVLGAAGFLVIFWWTVRAFRRGGWKEQPDLLALGAAFYGAIAAYFLQALVSLDEIALRLEFWAALAGVAAVTVGRRGRDASPPRLSAGKVAVALAVMLVSIGVAGWSARSLAPADHLALTGAREIRDGQVESGADKILDAIGLRDTFEYRRVYAESLGEAALDREGEGASLLREMSSQYEYLNSRKDPHAARNHARYLHAWSLFDPSTDRLALAWYREAVSRDPYNAVLAAQMSDVLVALDRHEEAVDLLNPLAKMLTGDFSRYKLTRTNQEFWGALAIAQARAGNSQGAREAIEVSEAIGGDDCRTWIAEELLKPKGLRRQPPGIGFLCPRVLLRLLPTEED